MWRYIVRRVLLYIPTLVLASMVIFIIMRALPGDIAQVILSDRGSISSMEQVEALRVQLGLNDHLAVQYGRWMWSMVNGQFGGESLLDGESLRSIYLRRLPVTLQLTVYTIIISWIVSIPAGIIAAIYQNRWPDYLVRIITVMGFGLPHFWLAVIVLLILLLIANWTPPLVYVNVWEDPSIHFQKMIWPTLILAWGFSSSLARVTRSSMLEVLRQDYVRTARSKGLSEWVVINRHALRNAIIPVITLAGVQLAVLMGGTVVLEPIFSLPGIGLGVVSAAQSRDFPVIQSLTMLLVFVMLTVNLVVDMFYAVIDARIRYS